MTCISAALTSFLGNRRACTPVDKKDGEQRIAFMRPVYCLSVLRGWHHASVRGPDLQVVACQYPLGVQKGASTALCAPRVAMPM